MKKNYLLKTTDVAEYCSVSERTVRGWLQNGQLRGIKVGRQIWRIRPEDLDTFLAGNMNNQPEKEYSPLASSLAKLFGE